jgi:carboxylesterase
MVNQIGKIYKKTKSVLFADPSLLYEEEKYLVNQPFNFPGNNKRAVLLIHGWTTVPYELRRLGKYLNEGGYTVNAPMLRGHGTVPKDLEDVKWTDWLEDLKKDYEKLKNSHEKVYIAGTSMGANLAVMLAMEYPEIAGLILMAMPYKMKAEKISYFVAKIMKRFGKYHRKIYPPTFGVSTTLTRLISYQTYPIDSAFETFNLVKKSREAVSLIVQPCFLLQSSSDHVISKKSMESIYNLIGSKVKKKKYINQAYHTFISDIKNKHVFEEILEFLNEN